MFHASSPDTTQHLEALGLKSPFDLQVSQGETTTGEKTTALYGAAESLKLSWPLNCQLSFGLLQVIILGDKNMFWFPPQRNFTDLNIVAFVLPGCKKAVLSLGANAQGPMAPVMKGCLFSTILGYLGPRCGWHLPLFMTGLCFLWVFPCKIRQ